MNRVTFNTPIWSLMRHDEKISFVAMLHKTRLERKQTKKEKREKKMSPSKKVHKVPDQLLPFYNMMPDNIKKALFGK